MKNIAAIWRVTARRALSRKGDGEPAPGVVMCSPLIVLLAVITGCTPSEHIADYGLQPAGPAILNGGTASGELRPFVFEGAKGVRSIRYEDKRLVVDWTLYSSTARLEIENWTEAPLRVIWSESRIEGDFEAPLVLAEPGTYDQRDFPQQPTVVRPIERVSYSTIPGPPGRWQPFSDDESRGFWQRERPMFDLDVDHVRDRADRESVAQRAVGSELRLVLALEIEGHRYELGLPARVVAASVRPTYY